MSEQNNDSKGVYIFRDQSYLRKISPEIKKSAKKVILSDSIEKIGDYVFFGYPLLEEVIISESVNYIDYCAFWDCKKLKKITMCNKPISISWEAFKRCNSLEEITLLLKWKSSSWDILKKIIGGSDVRTDIRPTYGQFNYVETKKPRDFTLNVVYENYDDLMYFIHDTKKNYKKYYYTPGRRLTINLIGKKLNFFQVAKINGMFTFESIAIFFKSNEESINDTKLLDKGNKSIRDEISEYSKEMLKEIESLIKVLPDDIKKIINNKIDSLLASYQREKNKLSKIDDISFEEEEIKLEIESKDPDVELYLELQNIKLSCNYHEKLLKDITSIDKCLEIFNTDINNKPDNIDSLEDIVRTCIYLIGIIDDKNRLKFSKKIKELLVGTKNECSSDLQKLFFTQSEIVLTVEGLVNTRLKVKLLEVLEEITIYSQKVLSYLDLLKSLEATKVDNIVNDGSINGTIMIMKYIVSHLENKKTEMN